tara:strand:- start:1357 stop:1629 length:273 start_codon:yes stop_codon:yes gene_type:complete
MKPLLFLDLCFEIIGFCYVLSIPYQEKPVDKLLEGLAIHKDAYGCCSSCGYDYCPSLDDCVRSWEVYCQEFQFPYNALWYGAGVVVNNTK